MDWRVPLFEPDFGPEELEAVQVLLRDGWITMGERTLRLESEFAARCGVKHAIAVNNCTAGLHLAVALGMLSVLADLWMKTARAEGAGLSLPRN